MGAQIEYESCQRCGVKKPVLELHGYDPFSFDTKKNQRFYCRDLNRCQPVVNHAINVDKNIRIQKAKQLKLEGLTIEHIAKILNRSNYTVYRYLQDNQK